MSGRPLETAGRGVRVLIVGASDRLWGVHEAIDAELGATTLVEPDPDLARERAGGSPVHCLVVDASAVDDLGSFVSDVRRTDDAVPVIVLGDDVDAAVAAGASDVLRTDDPRSLVASRVGAAADRYRDAGTADATADPLLEFSAAPVLAREADCTVRFASAALERRLGHTPDEVEGRDVGRIVHDDDVDDFRELLETVAADALGSTDGRPVRFSHDDGTAAVYDVRVRNRVADAAVGGLIATLLPRGTDPGADLAGTLDAIDDAIVAVGPEWEIRYANAGARDLFDLDRPAGALVWELFGGADTATAYEHLLEAATSGDVVAFEPERLEAGRVTVYPTPEGVALLVRRFDAALEAPATGPERETQFEAVVDALDAAVVLLDDGEIAYANAAAFELLDADRIVGRRVGGVLGSDLADAIGRRTRSAVVRWTRPIEGAIDRDGDRVPVAVSVLPLRDHDRFACVLRDDSERRRTASIASALAERVDDLAEAGSKPTIRRLLASGVAALVDADLTAYYRSENGTFHPTAIEVADSTAAGASDDDTAVELGSLPASDPLVAAALDRRGVVSGGRDRFPETLDRLRSAAGAVLAVPVGEDGIVVATGVTSFADRLDPLVTAFARSGSIALGRAERESALRGRETAVSRTRATIDRLRTTLSAVGEVVDAVSESRTRETFESDACAALADIDGVGLAWIGAVNPDVGDVSPRAREGAETGYLDAIDPCSGPTETEPACRTAVSREVTVVDDVTRTTESAAWIDEALDRGFRSAAAVPIEYDEYFYGVLAVYATEPSAFDDALTSSLVTVGRLLGFAFNAIETARSLQRTGGTEVELVVDGVDTPLTALSRSMEGRIDVGLFVPRSETTSTVLFEIRDRSAAAVERAAAELEGFDSIEAIGEGGTFRGIVAGERLVSTVSDHGALVRSLVATGDGARLVVDVPPDLDVGSLVRMLDRTFGDATLIARRERDIERERVHAFGDAVRDALTDRQLRTLRAAYHSGFFEWPREHTGEEVAETLGIAQPTFNRHFRAAQRNLFSYLFDEEAPPEE